MITRLSLSNFRSLGPNVTIDLGDLNFLIGTNGSGKSNILLALTFVHQAVRVGLPGAVTGNNGIEALRRYSSGHPHNLRIDFALSLDGEPARYGFEISGDRAEEYRVKAEWGKIAADGEVTEFQVTDGHWVGPDHLRPNLDRQSLAITALGGDPRIQPLWEFFANMVVYSIFPDVLREPQKISSETPMSRQGDNWVSILHHQKKSTWKRDLVAALAKLTEDIEDIKVARAGSYLVPQFRHKNRGEKTKKWFDAERESDGTLRVAGLLTALLQEPPLPVIGIEEPELTVHPGALPLLYDHLEEASHRSQIIVTSHSPLLLDYLNLERARVFVVDRKSAVTSVSPLSAEHRQALSQRLLTLGELMVSGDLQISLFGD